MASVSRLNYRLFPNFDFICINKAERDAVQGIEQREGLDYSAMSDHEGFRIRDGYTTNNLSRISL